MANYTNNLEKYKRMQQKEQIKEAPPARVTIDRVLGKPLMIISFFTAALFFLAACGGAYKEGKDALMAAVLAACLLCFGAYGFHMNRVSKFYTKAFRYLTEPGRISVKQLAIDTRYPTLDVLKLTKQMIKRRYYDNLTISDDFKHILIAPKAEAPKSK